MQTDVEQIAAGLKKAQREALYEAVRAILEQQNDT